MALNLSLLSCIRFGFTMHLGWLLGRWMVVSQLHPITHRVGLSNQALTLTLPLSKCHSALALYRCDRSENANYQYGKKRLREIDRRLRFLTKRLDIAEVVDPETPREESAGQVFFGATVTYGHANGDENTITIVGVDEIDLKRNYISWISPLARALTKARPGDAVTLRAPGGVEELDVIEVEYVRVVGEPFVPTEAVFAVDKKT